MTDMGQADRTLRTQANQPFDRTAALLRLERENNELRKALGALREDPRPRATAEQINTARAMYAEGSDDDIEIDDDALVSESDFGVWVQAWVWVPKNDIATDEERSNGPRR